MPTISAPIVAPSSGIRSRTRHDHGQGERRRHPEDLQDDEGDDAGDRRLRQRPADVAGDRDRHPVQRPADRRRLLGPPGRQDRLGPLLAPRDQEDAHDQDREQGEERSEQSGAEVGERPGDVVERAGRVVGDIFELADQVEVLVQVPERLAALDGVVEVGDVAREVGDEVAGSGHGRRHEDRTEQDRDQDQDQVDERDRRPARHPLLEPVDRRRHRYRDEGRDDQPADRRAQAVDQVEGGDAGDHGGDDPQDPPQGGLVLLDNDGTGRALGAGRRSALPAGGCGIVLHSHGC